MAKGSLSFSASRRRSGSSRWASRFSGFFSSSQRVPLQHLLVHRLGLALHVATQARELLVVELDDVETVEDNPGLRGVLQHRCDIRGQHVGGDCLEPGTRAAQLAPEGLKCLCAASLAHEDHCAAGQVQHDGQETR